MIDFFDIIFRNFFTFIGFCIILFLVFSIILRFKPIQINRYYINDKKIDTDLVEDTLKTINTKKENLEKSFKNHTLVSATGPISPISPIPVKKETSMNDSVWKILIDVL